MVSKNETSGQPKQHGPGFCCAVRRAARREEIERDHRLVSQGLVAELARLVAATPTLAPGQLFDRVDAVLAASRDDYHRLNNARINLRAARGVQYEDSVPLPAELAAYGHRGNYHGAWSSMAAIAADLAPLPGVSVNARELAEEMHRRCELFTLELGGVVHVFARPGSEADRLLGGSRRRIARVAMPSTAWPSEQVAATGTRLH